MVFGATATDTWDSSTPRAADTVLVKPLEMLTSGAESVLASPILVSVTAADTSTSPTVVSTRGVPSSEATAEPLTDGAARVSAPESCCVKTKDSAASARRREEVMVEAATTEHCRLVGGHIVFCRAAAISDGLTPSGMATSMDPDCVITTSTAAISVEASELAAEVSCSIRNEAFWFAEVMLLSKLTLLLTENDFGE